MRVALGRIRGRRAVVVAQARRSVSPQDLRLAQRGLRLAQRVGLPVVTIVDTPGGELSGPAEEAAMAGEIARTLQMLTGLSVPTVSCVMGQGCGGAALALIPARTVICMENGWVSPLPPEGASVISHRTPDRAAEMSRAQGVGALALHDAGVVDVVAGEGAGPARRSRGRDRSGAGPRMTDFEGADVLVTRFQGDTGEADPRVRELIGDPETYAAQRELVDRLAQGRLLIPVVANLDEKDDDGGDKHSHMATVTITDEQGRKALLTLHRRRLGGTVARRRPTDPGGRRGGRASWHCKRGVMRC